MTKKRLPLVAVIVLVLIVVSARRHRTIAHGNDLERLLNGISSLIEENDYWSATIALEQADGEAIAAKSLQSGKPIKLLAVASDLIEVPGVSKEIEHQSLNERDFKVVPGTGDAIPVSGRLRDRWVKAATRFATEYNRTVPVEVVKRDSSDLKSPIENEPVLAD